MSVYKDAARGGDTDFRKKWDRQEYARLGEEREAREKKEAKARYEAKLSGTKPKLDSDLDSDSTGGGAKAISARKAQDWSSVVNKSYLVPFGAASGRRGKGAGFYCEACDETYKDNNAWIDHINSKQHLRKTGQTYAQDEATFAECAAYLAVLKARKHAGEKRKEYVLDDALVASAQRDAEERAAKKAKKKQDKIAAAATATKVKVEEDEPVVKGEEEDEMARLMGFGGFATTKV